jgi:rubrerythrin
VDVPDFLIVSAELERLASTLYGSLAGLSPNPDIARRLNTLARDEADHADFLHKGQRYSQEMPGVFSGSELDDRELWAGMKEAQRLEALTASPPDFLEGLRKMLEFESRIEKIHQEVSAKIAESSLKSLFVDLMRWDRAHIYALTDLIETLSANEAGKGGLPLVISRKDFSERCPHCRGSRIDKDKTPSGPQKAGHLNGGREPGGDVWYCYECGRFFVVTSP